MTSNYDSYLDARARLIEADRAIRRDSRAEIRPIATTEITADTRIRDLRREEAEQIWKAEQGEDQLDLFPGMGFLSGTAAFVPSSAERS